MSGSARPRCPRCDREVEVQYEYSAAARRWWKIYLCVPLVLLPAFPFLAADYVFSLPLMMAYMLGIGPALAIVREPATCVECDALIPAAARPR